MYTNTYVQEHVNSSAYSYMYSFIPNNDMNIQNNDMNIQNNDINIQNNVMNIQNNEYM